MQISKSISNFLGFTINIIKKTNQNLDCIFIYIRTLFKKINSRERYYDHLFIEKLRLETLISMMADGAILLDKDLNILFINQSAIKAFEFFEASMVGKSLSNYLPENISNQLIPILNQMIQSSCCDKVNSNTRSLRLKLSSRSIKTFQLVMTAVFDPNDYRLTEIGIIIQDITRQISLDEAKAQFISNVSHELRTPLFNIRSFLETLSEYRNSLTEKQQIEFLEIANQETYRLTCLVNDVLDLSRLESDFLDTYELVEFQEIIPPVIQTYQLRANKKSVELFVQISSKVGIISGYTNLLVQVLSNLIGNSLKFTSIDGRIVLKVYSIHSYDDRQNNKSSKIRVEIIDEGTGINLYDQKRIFDRFVRLENNVHTLEGTGLGLSIVKNIVHKHKSNIYLYSELGIGSSFWFDLSLLEKKN
uniref:Uncharacterized sensor-like histidine kinase ycf26 n=1 Tax=Galaxaura rugosa TaxID=268570 RepID=A0A1G4NSU6_9FLOR|nr:Drug sensory protein A [Galaxaura rugosa]SCW21694.1 Drug sensory protein A [Galaxaura rugosa]